MNIIVVFYNKAMNPVRQPSYMDKVLLYLIIILDQGLMSPRELTPSSNTVATTPSVTPSPCMGLESMEVTPSKSGPPTPQLGSPTMMRGRPELGKRPYRRSSSFTEPKVCVYCHIFYCSEVCL